MAEVKTYPTGALPEVSLPTAPPRKGQKVPVPKGRYKARGVVLHTLKYGERQLIIHIFTAEYGRRSYITKLSQRNNPRGLFQPLFVTQVPMNEPNQVLKAMVQTTMMAYSTVESTGFASALKVSLRFMMYAAA